MRTPQTLEERLVNLESIIAEQDRLLDALNAEILRLNRLHERLAARMEAHEARHDAPPINTLAEEPPPPHW